MIPIDYRGFCRDLCSLAEEGTVPMERIDEAVRRILKLKFELGLFERPNTLPADYPRYGCEEHRQASYAAAAEAITLLKNDGGLLPLDPAAERRILVCGPNAQSRRALCGGWTVTWQGHGIEHHPELCKTLAEAIGERFGHRNVEVIPGVSYDAHESRYDTERRDRFDEAAEAARRADVVVLCLGENSYCEKPGDLNDLALDPLQTELAERIAATGKPVVLVLSEGRPRLISKFSARIPAIVQSYLPGPQGADAVADVLTGKVNPSGKLPYTYPAFPNSLAVYYHKYADEQRNTDATYKYEGDYNPEFVFGHGLSYTAFAYSGAKLTHEGDEIVITADVTNTGLRDGQEVVQALLARPLRIAHPRRQTTAQIRENRIEARPDPHRGVPNHDGRSRVPQPRKRTHRRTRRIPVRNRRLVRRYSGNAAFQTIKRIMKKYLCILLSALLAACGTKNAATPVLPDAEGFRNDRRRKTRSALHPRQQYGLHRADHQFRSPRGVDTRPRP